MTNLIANPKANFLLGAGLNILHQESTEWLDTIAFWNDEMKFFDKLLSIQGPATQHHEHHREILGNLRKIHGDFFEQLKQDIIEHEKYLAQLEKKEQGLADWNYREKHRLLKHRMGILADDFRTFKQTMFIYAKEW